MKKKVILVLILLTLIFVTMYQWRIHRTMPIPPSTLCLMGEHISDIDIFRLKGVNNIIAISLDSNNVSDVGLAYLLKECTQLKSLEIYHSVNITNDGLTHLKGLTKLESLRISRTKVNDNGLVHLSKLTNLTDLNLSSTDISDNGLLYLKGLTNLKYLDLTGTKIQGYGLIHLQGLTKLKFFHLMGTDITDSNLVYITNFEQLTQLLLAGTKISDNGIIHLMNLRSKMKCIIIELPKTISDDGINKLAEKLPHAFISQHMSRTHN